MRSKQLFDARKPLLPDFSKYKLVGQLQPTNTVARRSFRAIPGNRTYGVAKACLHIHNRSTHQLLILYMYVITVTKTDIALLIQKHLRKRPRWWLLLKYILPPHSPHPPPMDSLYGSRQSVACVAIHHVVKHHVVRIHWDKLAASSIQSTQSWILTLWILSKNIEFH